MTFKLKYSSFLGPLPGLHPGHGKPLCLLGHYGLLLMVREAKFRMSLIKSGQFFAESSVRESKYTFTLVYLSLPTTNC